uniref:leucine-rich repeat domain-containing protein n=1 Tax=Eubacterium cellulosolvens TaxID=29322 RepID=UPI000482ED75|nr:leucine-rich repeat domain-containing protein [[Eubacterium] cellulosolvens]
MRKKRFALILAACLLAQSCPYVVTAEQIEEQETMEDVVAASEEVILSGDCSRPEDDWWWAGESHVEWKVVKTDDDEKLKLLISGNGQMKDYSGENESLMHVIDLELADISGIDDAYVTEVEIGKGVTAIGKYTFCNSEIERVILPEGISDIGCNSFENCEKLKEINIPDTVTSIGAYAFCNCTQVKNINLSSVLKHLGEGAFSSCGLTSITIPNSLTEILGATFSQCVNLQEVFFPDEWFGTMGYQAFAFCNNLKELHIPEGVKTLDGFIWYGCPKLKTLYLPHSLTYIGGLNERISITQPSISDVYYNGTEKRWKKTFVPFERDEAMLASGELKIHFQEGTVPTVKPTPTATPVPTATPIPTMTSMPTATPIPTVTPTPTVAAEESILSGDCSATSTDRVEWKVEKTNAPDKLKLIITGTGKMEDYEDDSESLTHFIDLELSDLGFDDNACISDVEICEGIDHIGDYAFCNSNIERVSLPDSLQTIGGHSFEECRRLKEIHIPENTRSIGEYAFSSCNQLNSIELPSGLSTLGTTAFGGTRCLSR